MAISSQSPFRVVGENFSICEPSASADSRAGIVSIWAPRKAALGRFGCPDGIHYDVKGNLWAQMVALGGIVEIDPRGIILGFVPIPNGDLATTNFAFGGPDNQYIYFEGLPAGPSGASRRPIPA